MKLKRFVAWTLLGAAFAVCAAADEPRHAFECDTPAGHFSYWKRTVSATAIEVSGKIKVNEMLKDKKWSSVAFVSLRSEKSPAGDYGLRLYGIAKTPEHFFLELMKVGGRDPIGLGLIPATKDPIPFTLSLDSSGLLKLTLAGSEASTQLGAFKPETFEISCSTGDYEFSDVVINEK
jgi:hypothetical protein